MARIPLQSEDDPGLSAGARRILQESKALRGRIPNITRARANHPGMLVASTALANIIYGPDSLITPVERELAYTTATVVNGCYY